MLIVCTCTAMDSDSRAVRGHGQEWQQNVVAMVAVATDTMLTQPFVWRA